MTITATFKRFFDTSFKKKHPPVYQIKTRGIVNSIAKPWGSPSNDAAAGGAQAINFLSRNDFTVAGSKIVTESVEKGFFEFQNQSGAQDMRLSFGSPGTANTGEVVGAGQSGRWEITVPGGTIHVFCAVANEPYFFAESQPIRKSR